MTSLERWRAGLQKLIDDDLQDMDEDDDFWQLVNFSGQNLVASQLIETRHGGSRAGRSINVDRKRTLGHQRLWEDYFAPNPTHDELTFRRRNQMSFRLFNKILDDVNAHDRYFHQKKDVAGLVGLSPHQKITSAIRQLAYGIITDATDEYCRIGESIALESLYKFVIAMRELYESEYLKKPSTSEFMNQLTINQARGFPGMFGSLDCMHWEWKNCLVAWQAQFSCKVQRKCSIIVEAIANQELWIWHAFFGMAGGNNDLNVLDRSPLLNERLCNDSSNVQFQVNGIEYNQAYLLVDGIYPEWPMFISTVHMPQTDKSKHFAMCQEATRKMWKTLFFFSF